MKRFLKIGLFLIVSGSSLADVGDDGTILSAGSNPLTDCDKYGRLNTWWELGIIRLSDKVKIPLQINLNSIQSQVSDSMIGSNWWIPLLESSVVKQSEKKVVVRWIGGRSLNLYRSRTDSLLYTTKDNSWKGRLNQEKFDLRHEKLGWSAQFQQGVLKELKLPDGEILTWNYDARSRRLRSIKNSEGKDICRLEFSEGNYLKYLEFVDPENNIGKIEALVKPTMRPGLEVLVPTLTELSSPGTNFQNCEFRLVNNGSTALYVDDANDQNTRLFQWNNASGNLESVNNTNYLIEPQKNTSRPKLTEILDGKIVRSYLYDTHLKKSYKFSSASNETIIVSYLMGVGVNHSKINKIASLDKNGKEVVKKSFFYDDIGRVLKSVNHELGTSLTYDYTNKLVRGNNLAGEILWSKTIK